MARGNIRTRRSTSKTLLTVGLILVAGVALVTTLVLVDAIRLPFFQKTALASGEKSKDHGTDIPVPVCARAVPVFSAVQPQDLADPQTKSIKYVWLDPKKAKEAGFFTQYGEIVGRVLNHDKNPGYAFTEADFYPKGAQPTPANAVEEGKRGMYIDPANIPGLRELKRGDSFDLMSVKPGAKGANGQDSGPIATSLVSGGKVIMALPAAEKGKPKSGEQMYIQVSAQEFVDLGAALATGAKVSCASRPGIAAAAPKALPIPPPTVAPDTIEILSGKSGSRRQQVPSGSPSEEEGSGSESTHGDTTPPNSSDHEPKQKGVLQGEK
jgi:hypothetical protein